MKKTCTILSVFMLLMLCCFCACASSENTLTIVDHVVYRLEKTDKESYYSIVSLFDSKEAKQTVKRIEIPEKINNILVRSIQPITQLEYGTDGELCWKATTPGIYIDTVGAICESISLPRSVQSIGDLSFYNMSHLKSISLSDNLETIGAHAFDGCSSLQTINLPNHITEIRQNAFANCSALKKLRLPNQITVLESCTFLNCNQLKSIRLNNRLRSISWGAFSGCENLTRISLPKSLQCFYQGTFFDTGITKLIVPETCHVFFFNGMTELKEIVFADRSGKFKLPAHCFSNLTALQQVELPKHAQTTVGQYAFAHCVNLTKIKNTKTIVKLAPKSFYRCKTLPAFTLSDCIQYIADNAFLNCKGLAKLRFTGSSTSFLNHADFLQTLPDTYKIYVKTDTMKQAFLDAGCKNKVIVKADLK
ncbi:MAG: leucine-rich repeat domain-containing protein [Clostridia bacterium]|nr:leucine-rich repeat domain-containing protein [Clostridia bacterium]